jgi:hypothetical protein
MGSMNGLPPRCTAPLVCLLLWAGCGDFGQPGAGYSDPCATPMGPVLGCREGAGQAPLSAGEACRKLVSCGILADDYLLPLAQRCTSDADCGTHLGRKCRAGPSGELVCYYHQLDLFWCTYQLTHITTDPCDRNRSYTAAQVRNALSCIQATSCQGLGLLLTDKLVSSIWRKELDYYTCDNDSRTSIWTATICDHGLLYYGSGR